MTRLFKLLWRPFTLISIFFQSLGSAYEEFKSHFSTLIDLDDINRDSDFHRDTDPTNYY